MINDLISAAQAIPATGDTFPVKTLLIVVAIAAVIAVVTCIIAKKKK